MKISKIQELLKAEIICGEDFIDGEVNSACGCDMMSDVLAFVKDQAVLITGLCNPQVVRTAIMMDMRCIVLVRNKKPDEKTIELAKQNDIAVLQCKYNMFDACGLLYSAGLRGDNT